MTQVVDPNVMLILNSILLGLYSLTAILGGVKFIKSQYQPQSFLRIFFAIVCIIILIELALQIYQLIAQNDHMILNEPILIIVNIYAMLFQAAAMFILGDYWGQTSEILTKQSTQKQIKQKRHWVRITILSIAAAAFTAFVIWAQVTDNFNESNIYLAALVLGCQGLAVVLVLWANIFQIIMGYRMSVALKRYEDWVSSLSARKLQFCSLYWVSSTLNLLRSLFLIAATLLIQFGYENIDYQWLFGYIYTFTNVPILIIYLIGFSTKQDDIPKQSTLIDDNGQDDSPRRRGQTQLSRTHSSRSSV